MHSNLSRVGTNGFCQCALLNQTINWWTQCLDYAPKICAELETNGFCQCALLNQTINWWTQCPEHAPKTCPEFGTSGFCQCALLNQAINWWTQCPEYAPKICPELETNGFCQCALLNQTINWWTQCLEYALKSVPSLGQVGFASVLHSIKQSMVSILVRNELFRSPLHQHEQKALLLLNHALHLTRHSKINSSNFYCWKPKIKPRRKHKNAHTRIETNVIHTQDHNRGESEDIKQHVHCIE